MLRISLSSPSADIPPLPGLPPWMTRLLFARGIQTQEEARQFLRPSLDQLLPPGRLQDMGRAGELILNSAQKGEKAAIYGDYDVDGVSASAILWEALGRLGMERRVYIPDRHQEGYGLNTPAVEKLAEECRLLITVDCGITSVEEVKRAKELGLTVIVTDHHRHGPLLPPADAVITPLLGDYPFPYLCGAGVAWKLALQLLGDQALDLMDIAALATVADMVSLTGENRCIVALGLEKLSQTARPGLRALMRRAGVEGRVSSDQVAFQIAPRMNACGRMESAYTALNMLLTQDGAEAEKLALKMESLNQERKNQESRVLEDALSQVAQMDLVEQKAIVVRGEGWNSGVVGLAAGRVAEKYAYPTVALAQEGEMCVGSARSAGNIDIYQALSQCAGLFERFGGHKQAAGLTIRADRVAQFSQMLSQAVAEQTGGKPVIPEILCDGELELADVTEETVEWLERLEPFGTGNPAPRFLCGGVKPLSLRPVGAEGRHLKCSFQQGQAVRGGIFFGGGDWAGREEGLLRMAISPTVNEFRGKISPECRLYALELMPESLPPSPEREMLSFLSQPFSAGKAPLLSQEELKEWMKPGQGTALLCHCRETALKMLRAFPQADFCVGRAEDPRAFSAILLYGGPEGLGGAFRRAVLCDGGAGESGAWQKVHPRLEIGALPMSSAMREMLARLYLDRDQLRRCYAALRQAAPGSLDALSALLGLSWQQAAFACRVLEEIELIDFSLSPFRVSLLPMRRRGPEESGLFCAARRAKEDAYGSNGL